MGRLQRRHRPEGTGVSFHPNHATTCDQCETAGPDRIGLTVARDDQPHAAEHGFCSIACLLVYVRDHYLVFVDDHYIARALALAAGTGSPSAVGNRPAASGGTQAQPLGEVELEQVPPTSEAGA